MTDEPTCIDCGKPIPAEWIEICVLAAPDDSGAARYGMLPCRCESCYRAAVRAGASSYEAMFVQ